MWIKILFYLKKIGLFLKNNWYIPLLLVMSLVLYFVFRSKSVDMKDLIEIKRDSHQREVEVLERTHREEIERRENVREIYGNILEGLEEKFEEDSEALDKEKERRVKEIAEEFHDNPTGLSRRLAEEFGLTYKERG